MWQRFYPAGTFERAPAALHDLDRKYRRAIRLDRILDRTSGVDRLAPELAAQGEPVLPFMLRLAGDRSFHPVRLAAGPCGVWLQFLKVDHPRLAPARKVIAL